MTTAMNQRILECIARPYRARALLARIESEVAGG